MTEQSDADVDKDSATTPTRFVLRRAIHPSSLHSEKGERTQTSVADQRTSSQSRKEILLLVARKRLSQENRREDLRSSSEQALGTPYGHGRAAVAGQSSGGSEGAKSGCRGPRHGLQVTTPVQ